MENLHLHIVANRVHPQTFLAVDMYRDYEKLDRVCRKLEVRQGWTRENGLHVERDGELIRRPYGADAEFPREGRLGDMRAWNDGVPFAQRVKVAADRLKALLAPAHRRKRRATTTGTRCLHAQRGRHITAS